jgi:glutamate synthase domain-containing protein 2
VTLVITGGLRKPADFIKAMAMGADAIAVSNSAMQAIGCIAMRACSTNNCPVGIATQKPHLVSRIVVEKSAQQLTNFFDASVELMQVMARACGHDHLSKFCHEDLTTWTQDMSEISGVKFGGAG